MAVDFGDPKSGFHHSEVVGFINEEVLSNGGGPDFYVTFCSRPWNEIEDKLLSVVADPQVPRSVKRAYSWSALALSVRAAARQQEQQGRRIQRLQEQLEERETTTWALASQLQRLREEREQALSQLRGAQQHLQQALDEREALRGQLLHTQTRPPQVWPQTQQLATATATATEVWPLTVEERSDVLAAARLQRERNAEMQSEARTASMTATTMPGVLHVPTPPYPWAQVVQPPVPMPFPVAFPHPPPPPPRVVAEAASGVVFPPQSSPGGVCPPGMWPALGSQEETSLPWDQRSHIQEEGPVRSHLVNPSGSNWSHGDARKQPPQGLMPQGEDAPGTFREVEETPAPSV
ncbi:testis-expressed protein 13D-like [Leopardus geoffroyi]|uniref:testis-expressed protein 13D-like n=1 Tax=Leopardus geoffroyi TaxID=46844 RepID=UPI001E260988|nr:testis-expressed protein 13D-like [Leopardus geoffroyi]